MCRIFFFSIRLLSVLRGHSFFFIPTTTANDLSIFPIECSVLNKGTNGTIFITSLVWRGPWLGIEPGTSRTQSQHSTIRLSRRRWCITNLQEFEAVLHGRLVFSLHHGCCLVGCVTEFVRYYVTVLNNKNNIFNNFFIYHQLTYKASNPNWTKCYFNIQNW